MPVTVEALIASLKLATTSAVTPTPVAPLSGETDVTVGGYNIYAGCGKLQV